VLREEEGNDAREGGREGQREEEGLEGVMLQCGARGAVRLGKEVCVHIPSFPTAVGERRRGRL